MWKWKLLLSKASKISTWIASVFDYGSCLFLSVWQLGDMRMMRARRDLQLRYSLLDGCNAKMPPVNEPDQKLMSSPDERQCVTFSVSRVLLSKMKEMQLRTTSSLRALLNTEPLLPMMDTGIQKEGKGLGWNYSCCKHQSFATSQRHTQRIPVMLKRSLWERFNIKKTLQVCNSMHCILRKH